MAISSFKKGQIFKENLLKYIIKFLKYHKVLYDLLKFSQNRLKKILFSSRLKKGQEKPKWPNHFISRKLFQKRPNKADLAFLKAKWQPWSNDLADHNPKLLFSSNRRLLLYTFAELEDGRISCTAFSRPNTRDREREKLNGSFPN